MGSLRVVELISVVVSFVLSNWTVHCEVCVQCIILMQGIPVVY